ncbi:MAG: mechanosensitive ion channel family protein [Desulfobacterales bacterium]|nr:mechanosensitive ion channel family protein [Desulfobacterales bacterium]
MDTLQEFFKQYPYVGYIIKMVAVICISYISYFITKRYVVKTMATLIIKSKTKFDDALFQEGPLRRIAYLAPLIVIFSSANLFPFAEEIIQKISMAVFWWLLLFLAGALLTGLNEIYTHSDVSKGRSIKGYIQVIKILIYLIGGTVIISSLLGRSPLIIFSSFGAMTAVLLLIFRDTILSFVTSLQISSNDLVRVGDWIEVPKYGADGDVVDIALHTIKIQNWDKTFTIIPTHKLIEETFKNWRGMQLSGGRRIKRAIYIDIESVRFCDDAMVEKFKRVKILKDYVVRKEEELKKYNEEQGVDPDVLINGRRMTNIGTFRAYIVAYLKNHKKIHQGMTFIIRQLPPCETGLPIEIYVFTNDTAWANYEDIQADIFDHLLAGMSEFDLRIFQNPTGRNFEKLAGSIAK